jgi:chaperonin cofactor prefoldin
MTLTDARTKKVLDDLSAAIAPQLKAEIEQLSQKLRKAITQRDKYKMQLGQYRQILKENGK